MDDGFPTGWGLEKVADCMSAIIDYRGKTPKKSSAGIPLITAKIVKGGRILPVSEFIPPEDYDNWMRRGLPCPGDIVVTTEAPLGEIAQLDDRKVALAQRIVTLRGDAERLDNDYLKFAMQSAYVQSQLLARATGTTVVGIKQKELREVFIPLPPPDEQRAIASVLGSLDDKIELNRRMNRTLEQMAAAIFKAWFVDFDPVRAKASGATTFPGMPQQAFNALPTTFQDSPLGPIPEGWEVKQLPNLIEVNPKRTLKKGNLAPHLDMKNMPTHGHAPIEWGQRPFGSGMRFMNGDTLVARITPCLENGKTAFVDFLDNRQIGWGSTEYIVLRPKPPLPELYAYCLARTDDFREFAIQNMTGTSGRQRVPATALDQYSIVKPDDTTAKNFGEIVGPLFDQISANMDESRTLAETRDALLPKLLSGEIRMHKLQPSGGTS